METRCPEGAGPGQRSRPGSRQGSRPTSAKTDTEYQQQEDAEKDRVHQK
ncbi:hypothetical protein G5W58_003911 [Salmonella enterica subsp. enterica]|uniref:Uncharacterized protein n=1 Tax=Salmonella enterica TaxID=28901 RepID=A0A744BXS4_SALER|nr:hypothetical protein [Salmonella enterica]EDQ0929130.1 hypothetical protein [Salmonella enterica subsp. enterica serovar Anatum]EDW7342777.1 hypothetical protein [Salmonella enterica subsp. enterica serovar London]EEL7283705.1 hypothetical protein [Salmonella enterica subsp. enterica serovar Rubislaw]EDR5583089.1 hypothetical protein [Salmonella enterica]EDU1339581.1 hypothetical protein [Salmonella enterica]